MEALAKIVESILAGGPNAVIAILVLFLFVTLLVIRALHASNKEKEQALREKEERTEKLLENYYEANKTITEALNSVQIALIEIKSKL